MNKEEIIKLHEMLVELKDYMKENEGEFEEYEDLKIEPSDLHRSKKEHKHAVFVLGKELASFIAVEEMSDRARLKERMEELVKDMEP